MSGDPRKIAAIEAALERAASAASHGSQQVKSGQLDPTIEKKRELIKRLLQEAQAAYMTWAHWDAINNQLANKSTKDALDYFGLYSLGTVRSALARDALLAALRLSDEPAKDKISLCSVAAWLDLDDVAARLSNPQWALDLGHRPRVAEAAAKKNAKAVDDFRATVLPTWLGNTTPKCSELLHLRTVLRDVRDTRIAHFLTRAPKVDPTCEQIGRLLDLTLTLATDLAFVLLGGEVDAKSFKDHAHKEADKLWSMSLKAPRESYDQHRQARLAVGFADEAD
jgi:hypothetical protein